MTTRFDNALAIQGWACNPSGIILALERARAEAFAECSDTPAMCRDPAIRLITHQLCHVLGLRLPTIPDTPNGVDGWTDAMEQCCLKASAATIRATSNQDLLDRAKERAAQRWAISNTAPSDGTETLFWSNETGWGDLASATIFTHEEVRTVRLPVNGGWCLVG